MRAKKYARRAAAGVLIAAAIPYFLYLDLLPGGFSNPEFTSNWAGNQSYRPAKVHVPETVEEVVAVVRDALERGQKLYPIGSQHSWSFSVDPKERFEFINVDKLNQIHDLDAEKRIVHVGAGITIRDLNHHLLHHTDPLLIVQGTGSVQDQTVAGALSNSLNPYGGHWVTFSHYVEEIELVDGHGELRVLSDVDGDLMRAARVSLGLLGVITGIKLSLGDGYVAHRSYDPLENTEGLMKEVRRIEEKHVDYHAEFMFFPADNELGMTIIREATAEEMSGFDLGEGKKFQPDPTAPLLVNYAVQPLIRIHPFLEGIWMDISPSAYKSVTLKGGIDYLHHIFENETDDYTLYEYYIPLSELERLLSRLTEFRLEIGEDVFPSIFKFRVFRPIDNTLLSPQNGRPTFSFLYWTLNNGRSEEPYKILERHLIDEFDARHHWGTLSYQYDRETYKRLYGEAFDTFVEIRRAFDPEDMFLREPDKTAFK